eukprot:gnl/MRDRNA2_/MRDRNA2_93520_c0_seq1.p1 gnl/MRDRNA2_/MRDRNA2_93520_c0~~gnl/MRDRNA2_/MRDRNA2_93520_c0_seq1.p1  ORF type:complete len:475 (+),score=91.34 gnl/MRDRNA2_/MRDRNA2_93520_c0_seq1:150-1574(+)
MQTTSMQTTKQPYHQLSQSGPPQLQAGQNLYIIPSNAPGFAPLMSKSRASPRNHDKLPPLSQSSNDVLELNSASQPEQVTLNLSEFPAKSTLAILPNSREDSRHFQSMEQKQSLLQSELMIMHKTLKQEEDSCRRASAEQQTLSLQLTEASAEKMHLSEACSSTMAEREQLKAQFNYAESHHRRWYANFEQFAALHSEEAAASVRRFHTSWQPSDVHQSQCLVAELTQICQNAQQERVSQWQEYLKHKDELTNFRANQDLLLARQKEELLQQQKLLEAQVKKQEQELSKARAQQNQLRQMQEKMQQKMREKARISAMAMLASQDVGFVRIVFELWKDVYQASCRAKWQNETKEVTKAMQLMSARSKKMARNAGASLLGSQDEVLIRTVFDVWRNEWRAACNARWADSQSGMNACMEDMKKRFKGLAHQMAVRLMTNDSSNLVGCVFAQWRATLPKVKKKPGLWQRVRFKFKLSR